MRPMELYPYKFRPIYVEKIWGGRNIERLFARQLPRDKDIGESWELSDLDQGAGVVVNGPAAGETLTDLTRQLGEELLGPASPTPEVRFPLLLKYLDANDILSLQVHPDPQAAERIGGDARTKTECWYVLESRDGFIYKGLKDGVEPEEFRKAARSDAVGELVRRVDVRAGDFHYLPAGTVHALGKGVVVAEVQTPSDTTYRVTDWGRGRDIHLEMSMQCIHFPQPDDTPPGAGGEVLLATEYFTVCLRRHDPGEGVRRRIPSGQCVALMMLSAGERIRITHTGHVEREIALKAGDTLLVPAAVDAFLDADCSCKWLEVTLPGG